MFKDVGYYVVAVLVFSQVKHSLEHFIEYRSDLFFFAMLKHPLNDSAPILMHTHLVYSPLKCINNELHFRTIYLLNYLLDHMIPIWILNTLVYSRSHLINEDVPLIRGEHLKRFLHHPTSVLVRC